MMSKVLSFILASMLAFVIIGGGQILPAQAKDVTIMVNGKPVVVKGDYVVHKPRVKKGMVFGDRGRGYGPRPGYWPHREHNGVNSFVGGIVGGVVGNAVGNLFFPRPQPQVVVVQPSTVEPWSGEWYRICSETFNSFNPRTGYYVGYDGEAHFCTIRR